MIYVDKLDRDLASDVFKGLIEQDDTPQEEKTKHAEILFNYRQFDYAKYLVIKEDGDAIKRTMKRLNDNTCKVIGESIIAEGAGHEKVLAF